MNILATTLPSSVAILFAILFILAMSGGCFLLYRSIKKTYYAMRNNEDIENEDGIASKNELTQAMDNFIKRFRFDNEMTLIMIEYEDIKNIKESFGAKQYERALRQLTSRIKNSSPKNAMLAKAGADQYLILLRGQIPVDKLESYATNLLNNLESPLSLNLSLESKIVVNCSCGIVTYPEGGHFPSDLLKNVEMALYMCKKDSSQRFVTYSEQKDKSEGEKLEYYREIKEAMRNKEFTLVYQPIIDTKNNTLRGFESLIRWVHPTLGVLSPAKFLNIMEHTGDIIWVGKWGIEVLCEQFKAWKAQYPQYQFFLSFNISPKQLMDPQIAQDFNSIVKKSKVNPENICLEIVEFAMFDKYSIVSENIQKLHNVGFKIAIDDFGLDVNSLSRISNLPIDIIKFDRNFLSDIDGNFMLTRVASMLVDYSNEAGKQVVAEGIETLDMLAKIEGFGIFNSQGYLFSKPLPPLEVEKYVNEEAWKVNVSKKPETVEVVNHTESEVIDEVKSEE